MQAGPDPGDHVAQIRVPLHLVHGNGAPVGHEPGVDRLVVDEGLADTRVQPVRGDGYPGRELAAVGAAGDDAGKRIFHGRVGAALSGYRFG